MHLESIASAFKSAVFVDSQNDDNSLKSCVLELAEI